eukprot:751766-Hanusia_phi.AAC.3
MKLAERAPLSIVILLTGPKIDQPTKIVRACFCSGVGPSRFVTWFSCSTWSRRSWLVATRTTTRGSPSQSSCHGTGEWQRRSTIVVPSSSPDAPVTAALASHSQER